MLITGNQANDRSDSGAGNGNSCFREHNQRMKEFRLAHPQNWRQWHYQKRQVQENPLALPRMTLVREMEQCRQSPN